MLKIKRIPIETFGENVVFLSDLCTSHRPDAFRGTNKALVSSGSQELMAAVNIVHGDHFLDAEELGLSLHTFDALGMDEGTEVHLTPTAPPASMDRVRAKVYGGTLSADDLAKIVRDIADHRYTRMEITAFLMACASFMTTEEVINLTKAMASIGTKLQWQQDMVVDKHCIGGIPGNRTSMIVVPIVAAYGLAIPKTSSRAITSPAGTADTMEVLANVDVSMDHMVDIVNDIGGCLVWGGHVNLSPADDILISVERPLAIDTPEQMVASILSKKVAAGSTHLVIDMPVGPSAKVRNHKQAIRLRKLFEHVGQAVGLQIDVVTTDGSQPVGRGIGPVLEARDVMAVLRGDAAAPQDLRDRALVLAGHILEFDPNLTGGEGFARAETLLKNGSALKLMERLMAAQGPPPRTFTLGNRTKDVVASSAGVISAIDCYRMAQIARQAGAPMAKGAGIDLNKKAGDPVVDGELLYTIYAETTSDFERASAMAADCSGYEISHV